ncbi:actin depolymerizing factor [Mucor mucedo]|uniref:actin depolymerizing factor n=1 Tax=Mucor mucedo TaxID=29922 RepID=UPI002220E50E|nr:actin depolymerizing factor [Mucor mucedo]KAI7889386.1 actin depolymerizing factor [Mucor mucedo]
MSSGVAVNSECLDLYQELKLRKSYKYLIFKLSDNNQEIVVEKSSETGDYDDFLSQLPDNEPRYAVYDFEYEKPGDGKRNKITFYSWIPDTAKVRQKMLYASSKEALRRKLVGIAIEVQGTDASEVCYEVVLEKANRSA